MFMATIPAEKVQDIFAADGGLEPIITAICERAHSHVADMTTAKGRGEVRALAYKVTRSKTFLDDIGKKLVAELKDLPKRIDANRKAMRDQLDALAEEVRTPLTKYEARVQKHLDAIAAMSELPSTLAGSTADDVAAAIMKLEGTLFEAHIWEEFADDAKAMQDKVLPTLREMFDAKFKAEKDAFELEQLRAKQAERDQKDREERIAREAAENARKDAEEKAERERQAALGREAEAKRQQELAEARQRDAENFRKINSEVAADIFTALSEQCPQMGGDALVSLAKSIVKAIVKDEVRHTKITY
jgi:hypothetical protein